MITALVQVSGGGSGLEVVDDPADGLDVGVLGLPLVVAAVVSTLHDVHAAAEVWFLVHHPAAREHRDVNTSIHHISHNALCHINISTPMEISAGARVCV